MFQEYEHKFFSQNGEDGVLAEIFKRISTFNKFLVEVACGDGRECNGRFWVETQGWQGLFIDGRYQSKCPKIEIKNEFVTAENINSLLDKYQVPQEFDLLSIDIDGNDYWLLNAINRNPRVIIIEYNASIPPNKSAVIDYDPKFAWDGSDYFGASLKALENLAEATGYQLVYCEKHGVNAFFVRSDLVSKLFEIKTIYRPPNYFGLGLRHPVSQRKMSQPERPKTLNLSPSPREELSGFNQFKKCRYGSLLYNINDMYIGRSLDHYGEWSQGEVELFQQLLRPQDIVIEIGANIGVHTLFFANAVGAQGQVFAFEPQRIIFQTLCANLALNSVTNTHCYSLGLGSEVGSSKLPPLNYQQTANFGGVSLGNNLQGETVQVEILDNFSFPHCRLIKIDVEGMELQVLKGATQTLKQFQPALYLENDRPDKSEALIRYLDSIGYDLYWHCPPLYNPQNYFQNQENVFKNIVSKNMLGLPRQQTTQVEGLKKVEIPDVVVE